VTELAHATILVEWAGPGRELEPIEVQYNPTEITFDKGAQIAEIGIPGLDAPLEQFVRGQAEKLTLELFFDTTDEGMGAGATSVTTRTDKIYQLVKIEPTRHAPPVCIVVWNQAFPGSSLDTLSTKTVNGTSRHGFRCIVENVRQKFTLFSPEGVPLRATLTVTFREYRALEQQLTQLKLSSPDRTHAHVVEAGDTLARVAHRYYERPDQWRPIAEENGIDDPRRLNAGTFLRIPPTR
jgi:LysM repeat protein